MTFYLIVMYEPVPDGMHKGMHCPPDELNAMLDAHYALRGWTSEGIPTVGETCQRWAWMKWLANSGKTCSSR